MLWANDFGQEGVDEADELILAILFLDLPLATRYLEFRRFRASFNGEAVMRYVWFLIFVIFVAIIGIFAFENSEPVAINYLDQSLSVQSLHLPMSLLIGGVYVLGMLTGWTVIGFLKRTAQHVTEGKKG